ncbi:MAG: hypothetical protein HW403_1311 [Dehalococcoidia bacterium]|nr:hypothetical protein [Dehalococcoidia bacterium]
MYDFNKVGSFWQFRVTFWQLRGFIVAPEKQKEERYERTKDTHLPRGHRRL